MRDMLRCLPGSATALLTAILLGAGLAAAQGPPAPAAGSPVAMERRPGGWVEGPGFDITYGGNYEACARRCLQSARCRMIEFYRPERKCNLYETVRAILKGGASDVAIRRP